MVLDDSPQRECRHGAGGIYSCFVKPILYLNAYALGKVLAGKRFTYYLVLLGLDFKH